LTVIYLRLNVHKTLSGNHSGCPIISNLYLFFLLENQYTTYKSTHNPKRENLRG
jgi:hypothetical protein